MSVSVILSTYNGSKYIIEQLESIKKQTYSVDEVLICDDCSTDRTVDIIKEFISRNKLEEKWKLTINSSNKGWKRNFYELFLKASGDYIFTCDQDDIWDENKIKLMVDFISEKNATLVASDYIVFYEGQSVRLPRTKISKISSNHSYEKIKKNRAILLIDRPGCTYCISSKIKEHFKQLWFDEYPHDALLWRIAFLTDSLYILHEPLIRFRRHELNASDYKNRTISDRIEVAKYFVHFLSELVKNRDLLEIDKKKQDYIKVALIVQEKRIEVLKNRNLLGAVLMVRYAFYYPTVNTYLADVQAILKGK